MKKATKNIINEFKRIIEKYRENVLVVRFEGDRPHYFANQSVDEQSSTYYGVYELTYTQFKELYSCVNEFNGENPYIEMGFH